MLPRTSSGGCMFRISRLFDRLECLKGFEECFKGLRGVAKGFLDTL